MKPSVKLQPNPWDLLVVLAVAACAAALGVFLYFRAQAASAGALTAVITQNGAVVDTVVLADIAQGESREIDVDGDYSAVVELEPTRVRIASATCPTQDCVHTGWISQAGQSIVCLPNHLVVQLTGGGESGVDAVIG